MNRDLEPSFSLGISQLESIKESHEVVNFIFESFDYEFVDFDENRLKHRNDLQIMKKLWQKQSKEKKKKVVLRKGDPTVLKVKLSPREEELSKQFPEMNFPRDCGVFVDVYAEYLSEGLDIPSSEIDAHYHRLRYDSLLCKYGSLKADNGYFSENDDPPRPRMKFTPKEIDRVLRIQ
ncbi:hypothetical protein CQW23_14908 [Capsicum baccatum]|uniref:Ubiquitin-like protease family profile domain-containing protein n=1 Tax=Capsicum baccatum TaxID=33114 RepID=A0A2G2WKR7_CAPBA|nr:hypothetical protein CQW23_14908 [Capsicum baccatum]